MSAIEDLFDITPQNWVMFFFTLALLIFAIPTIIEQVKKLLSALGLRTEVSIKEDEQTARVVKIESGIEELHGSVDELKDNINKLTAITDEHIKRDNLNNVAMIRNELWKIYKDSEQQGYITEEGIKTFIELGQVYEDCGGDDIYHSKLYPEVMKLEIRD